MMQKTSEARASDVAAVISARGGSKGVPDKNLVEVAGKPLIVWTIEQALAAIPAVHRVIVSTDCPRIAAVAEEAGAEVPGLRQAHLARDDTPTEPVLLHVLELLSESGVRPAAIMLLQPTSPLRLPGSIARAVDIFWEQKADSLISVVETHAFFWRLPDGRTAPPTAEYDYLNRPRRQDIAEADKRFRENGSIYITRSDVLEREKNRLGGRVAAYVMDEIEGVEIDSLIDFAIIEALFVHLNQTGWERRS